ncbi:MAG: hypothetical protein NZM25_00615 [Leptospiraceae bacterium]|nr:hypothetical protein [Leptospiraceae bacterium]MDW8306227.1 hypothetical protein [Leptospiraceae bacterium]
MGGKFEFDDTRKAIGVEQLSEAERKAMLEKFKAAGGKVLQEREIRPDETSSRKTSSPQYEKKQTVKLPSEIERERRRALLEKKERERENFEKQLSQHQGLFSKFFIRLRCILGGLTPFGLPAIRPAFMNFLALNVRQALVEFNLTGNDLFFQQPAIGRKIIHSLDQKNPLLMEVLEAAHRLYHAPTYNALLEFHQNHPGAPTPLESIAEPLKALFRSLYVIYPFQETLKKAFNLAFDIYLSEDKKAEKEKWEAKRKKVLQDVKTVFEQAFPKIFQLICLLDDTDYPPFSSLLEKSLGIHPEDKLGKRRRGESSLLAAAGAGTAVGTETGEPAPIAEKKEGGEEISVQEKKEEPKPRNPILATKEYQYGYSLMKMMTPRLLREKHDPKAKFKSLPDNDKVLLAYLYFLEFDYEYSFVLTTSKIKLNVDYSGGVKNDYKKILTDIYNESRNIIRTFEKYQEAVENLEKLKKNKLSSNYIEQSKLETKQQSYVDIEGRNTRGLIRTYMENVYKSLGKLIADMKGPKTIVANSDELITFDKEFEGTKRLNGKSVQHCILEAYCYALALKERLESGDLYGGVLHLSEEEMREIFGEAYVTPVESSNES